MVNKNRDSKFVIYQVLYIFVITVLALKGADLDLNRVISRDKAVSKTVKDSLVTLIDSLTQQGLKFNIQIDPNVVVQNEELKKKIASMNEKMRDLSKKIVENPPVKKPEKPKEQTVLQSPIAETQTFIQWTWNKAKNNGDVPTYIYDPRNMNTPIVMIPPGQEKTFDLTDENEVIEKFGSQQQPINVLINKPPEIKIQRVTTKMDGTDIYVKDLQRITDFTVTIIDERPDQLNITHSGPISVTGPRKNNKGQPVYNVSLYLAPTQEKFDEWVDRNGDYRDPDGRYKVNFFFIAVDQRTKDRVQVGDSFYFTDYSK
jgi:hypothetical protein